MTKKELMKATRTKSDTLSRYRRGYMIKSTTKSGVVEREYPPLLTADDWHKRGREIIYNESALEKIKAHKLRLKLKHQRSEKLRELRSKHI